MRSSRKLAGSVAFGSEPLEKRQLLAGGVDRLVNNNIGTLGTSNFTQNEPTLVTDGTTVVVGFDDSGSNSGGVNRFTGFSRSTDGGNTFADGGSLPASAGGDAGEARLVRDATSGRIYFGTLGFSVSTLQLFKSTDNGATLQPPIVATPGGSSEDVFSLAVDNFSGAGAGNLYLASRRFGGAPGIYFFRSADQGATFGPAGGILIAAATNSPQGPAVVVGPDHAVYVFWYDTTGAIDSIKVRKSTDQGLTFAAPVTIAADLIGGTNGDLGLTGRRNGTATFNPFRSNAFPRPAVNPVNGHLYVVFNDDAPGADKANIYMVQSTNGGASWSARVQINDDSTTTDQWQPAIAVSPDGSKFGIFYYSRQEDTVENNLYRLYGRIGTVSGSLITFDASSPVSDVASFPEFGRDSVVNSVYMGDWLGAVATNGAFHVVWGDARDDLPGGAPRKDPNVYYDRIPIAGPTVVSSQFQFQSPPQRFVFTFDQNVGAALSLSDFVFVKLPAGPTVTPASLSFNSATNVATINFAGTLADGNYLAIAQAAGITNTGGMPMPADFVASFFFLNGDANRDRAVNLDDFTALAANFGLPGRVFSQGDFTYDTTVNLDDFTVLASQFGKTLPAPGDLPRVVAGVAVTRAPRFSSDVIDQPRVIELLETTQE